jgi:hypothetical protein
MLESAKGYLAQARGSKSKSAAVTWYAESYRLAVNAWEEASESGQDAGRRASWGVARHVESMFQATAHQISGEALADLKKLCRIKNPSEAEYGALGAGAGALLLGPVGAIAGGYFGAREGGKKKSKPRKKNPRASAVLRNAMKGT